MKIAQIKLYGAIEAYGDNCAASFTNQLTAAQKDADVIELHIHCPGGDVFEGSVIYNAIKESQTPIDVYIDGMAASMASVIMLAARKIYMAENAFIMIHAPHTFLCGNAEELEKAAHLLRSIETNFIEAFCARTGKEKDAVAEWLKGDNWFSAQEAADEKLIDGIVGASNIKIESTEDDLKKTNATALLKRFEAIAKINYQPQKHQEMNKKDLINRYGLTTVTEASSDEDIMAAIDAKINEGKQEAAAMRESQIKAAIDRAVAEKKISEQQRKTYEAIGAANGIETLNQVLADIRVQQSSITSQLTPTQGAEAHADWTWDDWQKEDPRGLEALAKTDPEKFNALYNAKYKKA